MAFKTTDLSFSLNAALSKNLGFSWEFLISVALFSSKDSTGSSFSDSVFESLTSELARGSDTSDLTGENSLFGLSVVATTIGGGTVDVEYSESNDPLLIGNSGSLEKMLTILLPAASTLAPELISTSLLTVDLIGMMIGCLSEELSVVIDGIAVVVSNCSIIKT